MYNTLKKNIMKQIDFASLQHSFDAYFESPAFNFHTPRGFLNNNPANIRHSSSKWRGLSSAQTDKFFCRFDNVVFGVRALLRTLRTYSLKYNLTSIGDVVTRFAPPSENNSNGYINSVLCIIFDDFGLFLSASAPLNHWVDKTFVPVNYDNLYMLCYAMCVVECGYKLDRKIFAAAFDII